MTISGDLNNPDVEILIAEDSATQAQRLSHMLTQQGFRVTHSLNGREALASARRRKPALVISDIVMPEMDGYELCRQIKSDPILGDVPVILVTTLSDPGDVITGLECHADNFIIKPYNERYLLSRVHFVLLNRQIRETQPGGLAVEVFFNGQRHVITADRLQILNLLLSTYEAAIQRNRELTRVQDQLTKRTADLAARQKELQASQSFLEHIIAANPSIVARLERVDENVQITYSSPNIAEVLGYRREDVVGVPNFLTDTLHPDDRELAAMALREVFSGSAPQVDLEQRCRAKNGEYLWFLTTLRAERTEDNRVEAVLCHLLNITDRKHAEMEMQRTEQFLNSIFENSPSAMFVKDARDLRFVRLNHALENLVGVPRDKMLAKTAREVFASGEADAFTLQDRATLDGQTLIDIPEQPLRTANRGVRIVHTRKIPITDEHGAPQYLLGITEDITERKRAEQALVESEERTRRILGTAHDAFIGIDDAGLVMEWNVAAQRVFGWSREEVLGRPLADLIIPPAYRQKHAAGLAHLRLTGEGSILNKRVEMSALRRDGAEFPVDLIIWPVEIAGRMLFNAFIRDITQQKHAEAAIREAKEEAERANRAKSDFLSRMSHDLRTPLNAILGFAQLLESEGLRDEHREALRHILKGGAHLLDLINEVLDIARIEAGHLSLSPEPVPIEHGISQVVDMVRPLAAQRQVSLHVDTSLCRARHVFADRQRLNQILLNLLSNAVKYNRDGGVVHVACEERLGDRVRIQVTDSGAGIPPHKLELLFQPFERLGAEQTSIEGTGLGLALSKALAEAMGGRLGVESTIDHGSTFWVELAFAEHAADAIAAASPPERAMPTDNPALAGLVLYIEDNVSNQRLMERVFARRPGVRLVSVAQGQTGLDLARTSLPDLILLDLHLPDLRGEEVLERLWQSPETRSIPVAVLSADATHSQVSRLLAAGASAYLTKPLNIPELLRFVDATLGRAAMHSPDNA